MGRLNPVYFKGRGRNPKILSILEDGFNHFQKEVNNYCTENGSHDTILGWGTEKSYMSMFSHGLDKKGRICLLELPFKRKTNNKNDYFSNKSNYTGHVDAFLVDRHIIKNGTLTAVIEAKATHTHRGEKEITERNLNSTKRMLNAAKKQIESINKNDISYDEQFESLEHAYKIALIFTVVKVRNAKSGKGKDLEWKEPKEVISEVEEYFETIKREINGKNILHWEYYHSPQQIKLIREWNGYKRYKDGKEVDRTAAWTHYYVGALVTAALYR